MTAARPVPPSARRARVVVLALLGLLPEAAAARTGGDDPLADAADAAAAAVALEDGDPDDGGTADDPAAGGDEAPVPRGFGRIRGTVTDETTGEPLVEAAVEIVETGDLVRTDLDGRYGIDLRPGSYTVRVYYPFYTTERVRDVRVRRGGRTRLDAGLDLAPDGEAGVETVEVVARAEAHTEAAQLLQWQESALVSDAISAQEMSRSASGSAADAARRVTGASIVDDRYVYVRGLGERYGNTVFNGTILPSPEPDRRVVPLDLFPTNLLESFQIVKTAAPNVPADFAGGSAQITTRQYPGEFSLRVGASLAGNTQATFRTLRMPDIQELDLLGFDDGTRDILDRLPAEQLFVGAERPDGTVMTAEEVEAYGESLHNDFSPEARTAWPSLGFNVSVGDTLRPDDQLLGWSLALTYSNTLKAQEEVQRSYSLGETDTDGDTVPDASTLVVRSDYAGERATNGVLWGALGNFAWQMAEGHEVRLSALYTRKADNAAMRMEGKDPDEILPIRYDRIQYTARDLFFGQLQGEHDLPAVGDSELRWQANLSTSGRYEPDTREVVYQETGIDTDDWVFYPGSQSGAHFSGDLFELSGGGGLDWIFHLSRDPDDRADLQIGTLIQHRERTSTARRFRFLERRSADPEVLRLPADELFTAEYIGPALRLEEFTRIDDAYGASQLLAAAYGMFDLGLWPGMRAVAGVRMEMSDQEVVTENPYAPPGTEPTRAGLETLDFFPSVNLVQILAAGMNLRAAVSQTTARPEFRELTPFAYFDFVGGQFVFGNPDLQASRILNTDLRWEWFPAPGDVVAVSAFYKHLEAPIEATLVPTSELARTYNNASSAWVAGAELEARTGFGFLHEDLAGLQLIANFTYVYSRVSLDPEQAVIQTSQERPLQGQSPYVVNLGLDYANDDWGTRLRLLYNVLGPRIDSVGAVGLPDVYEEPRHLLDFVAEQDLGLGMNLKLTVQNLLDQEVRLTQGGRLVTSFRPGVNLALGFSWSY